MKYCSVVFTIFNIFLATTCFAVDVNFTCSDGLYKLHYENDDAGSRIRFYRYNEDTQNISFSRFNFQYDSSKSEITYDRGDKQPITESQTTKSNGDVSLGIYVDITHDPHGIDFSYSERNNLKFNLLTRPKVFGQFNQSVL